MKHSLRLNKYVALLGAAALVAPAGLNAQNDNVPEGLQPVLSSVSDLTIKGSFGAEFGASGVNRNRGNAPADSFSTFNVSHLRLGVEATVYDDFHFDTVLSMLPSGPSIAHDLGERQFFVNPGVNLYRATLTYGAFEPFDVTLGYDRPRFGIEASRADEDLNTITRSVLSTGIGPRQHTGVSIHGEWDILDYHAGIYNADAGSSSNAPGVYPVSYMFTLGGGVDIDEWAQIIHPDLAADVRVDYIHVDETGGFGPPAGIPAIPAFPGSAWYKQAVAIGADVDFAGLNVTYEYMWARANDQLGFAARPRVRGFVITPSYFLTDDFEIVGRYERIRNTEVNTIGGLLPHNAYANSINGLQPPFGGSKYQAVYLGGNYYLHEEYVKLMGGLELAELRGPGMQSRTHTAMTALRMQF